MGFYNIVGAGRIVPGLAFRRLVTRSAIVTFPQDLVDLQMIDDFGQPHHIGEMPPQHLVLLLAGDRPLHVNHAVATHDAQLVRVNPSIVTDLIANDGFELAAGEQRIVGRQQPRFRRGLRLGQFTSFEPTGAVQTVGVAGKAARRRRDGHAPATAFAAPIALFGDPRERPVYVSQLYLSTIIEPG